MRGKNVINKIGAKWGSALILEIKMFFFLVVGIVLS